MAPEGGAVHEARGAERHAAGDYPGALECFERAYEAYRREGDVLSAAGAARTVGWFRGWVLGDWAVHQGWSSRARSLLEQAGAAGAARARGWLLLLEARAGQDPEAQRRQYLDVVELARACGDGDLECEAIASLGIMLVFSGRVAEGMAHLDDALAAICGGDVEELSVVEGCLCGMLYACEHTHDVGRAQQWLRAASGVIERRGLVAAGGYCRGHYGSILMAAGRWADAEAELASAVGALPAGSAVRESALCRLADLRARQGRVEEAAELLAGLEHHDDALRPLAAVHLARGEPDLAVELLERALAAGGLPDHVQAPLLAQLVEAQLTLGATDQARRAGARLAELARAQPSDYLLALAAVARARLCTAAGESDARDCLHQAMAAFAQAGMPVEVARCRLALARLLAPERPGAARAEATAAHRALADLGAVRDADEASALLRSLGAPAPPGRTGPSALTGREAEVLALLAHGLTNVEIGERLFISAKTVEHHVGRILSKLGLRSRAEAAAHAVRAGSGPS